MTNVMDKLKRRFDVPSDLRCRSCKKHTADRNFICRIRPFDDTERYMGFWEAICEDCGGLKWKDIDTHTAKKIYRYIAKLEKLNQER